MKRLIHIGLLLMALLGVMGQATAMAMMPARAAAVSGHQSTQVSMADMDCMDMANTSAPGKSPCKKITLQCMAAMGCVSLALVEPDSPAFDQPSAGHLKATLPVAARLSGRSYGPEPDPPSFLI